MLAFEEGEEEGIEEASVVLLEGNVLLLLLLLLPAPMEDEDEKEVGGGVAIGADEAAG